MDWAIDWSEPALTDLYELTFYIARDDPTAAQRMGTAIVAAVDRAAVFPAMGRLVDPQQHVPVRELIVPPYRIFYRADPLRKTLFVIRVWHAARGTPPLP